MFKKRAINKYIHTQIRQKKTIRKEGNKKKEKDKTEVEEESEVKRKRRKGGGRR